MAYLLDTHAVLWALEPSSANLSDRVRQLLEQAPEEKYVSPVSAYELGFKAAAGKMPALPATFHSLTASAGFHELAVTVAHAELAAWLPLTHRDPWDRLLAAQAIEAGCILITADRHLPKLGVQTIW